MRNNSKGAFLFTKQHIFGNFLCIWFKHEDLTSPNAPSTPITSWDLCTAVLNVTKPKTRQTTPREPMANKYSQFLGHTSCKLGSSWQEQKEFIPYFQYYKMQTVCRFQGALPGHRSMKCRGNQLQTASNRKEQWWVWSQGKSCSFP